MSQLATTIATRKVPQGSLALYWLCQAGFAFKTSAGQIVYIDPYFSEVVERLVGFKRMMASPIQTEEVVADLIICTHEHLDHMDTDALPALALKPRTHFAGPIECVRAFAGMGISSDRCHLLQEGKTIVVGGVEISAVYADHGDLAPDALGVVLDFAGIRVLPYRGYCVSSISVPASYRHEVRHPAPVHQRSLRKYGLEGGGATHPTRLTASGAADALLDVYRTERRPKTILERVRCFGAPSEIRRVETR